MRILYLCIDPSIDVAAEVGGAVHIRSMIQALTDLGHEVTAGCTHVSRRQWVESQVHARVVPCGVAGLNRALGSAIRKVNQMLHRPLRRHPDAVRLLHNAKFFNQASEIVRRFSPDFIYERYSLWGIAGLAVAKRYRLPFALEVNAPLVYEQQRYREGLAWPGLARRIERYLWRSAEPAIVVSDPLRRHLTDVGATPERVRVLPNAVDVRRFLAGDEGMGVRSGFERENRFVLGFVGSFKAWHGADFLLSVFEDFHRCEQSAHLLLVGDGPLKHTLEEQVRKAGLAKAVTFTGIIPHEEMSNYLGVMDVALAPYPDLENFYYSPLKLFEYMAAGKAVVASRTEQVAQIIHHGVTGLLYEPGDRRGVLSCLHELRRNPALREELGRNAKRACVAFTWERNAARVVEWVQPKVAQGPLRTVQA